MTAIMNLEAECIEVRKTGDLFSSSIIIVLGLINDFVEFNVHMYPGRFDNEQHI